MKDYPPEAHRAADPGRGPRGEEKADGVMASLEMLPAEDDAQLALRAWPFCRS